MLAVVLFWVTTMASPISAVTSPMTSTATSTITSSITSPFKFRDESLKLSVSTESPEKLGVVLSTWGRLSFIWTLLVSKRSTASEDESMEMFGGVILLSLTEIFTVESP